MPTAHPYAAASTAENAPLRYPHKKEMADVALAVEHLMQAQMRAVVLPPAAAET